MHLLPGAEWFPPPAGATAAVHANRLLPELASFPPDLRESGRLKGNFPALNAHGNHPTNRLCGLRVHEWRSEIPAYQRYPAGTRAVAARTGTESGAAYSSVARFSTQRIRTRCRSSYRRPYPRSKPTVNQASPRADKTCAADESAGTLGARRPPR